MTLGDNIAHPLTGDTRTDAERHRQLVEQSVWAAGAGFDAVHIGEHHFNDYMLSSPPVVLAAIGERLADDGVHDLGAEAGNVHGAAGGQTQQHITDLLRHINGHVFLGFLRGGAEVGRQHQAALHRPQR